MLKKIFVLFFAVAIPVVVAQNKNQATSYQSNSCVACHSKITQPLGLSSRYFEWHTSSHKEAGVSCEKCHGGDATNLDKAKAHVGVQPYSDLNSKINFRNLPATCSTCHKGVVDMFVESKHYKKLQGSGLGPSCTNCHSHMGSEVVKSPPQVSILCAHCHDTIGGSLRARPEIPMKAEEVIQALNRADVAVEWAASLLRSAETQRIYLPTQRFQVVAAQGALKEAKFSWHAFDLETTQKRAEDAFAAAIRAKDELKKKVIH